MNEKQGRFIKVFWHSYPIICLHGLRHTAASYAISMGENAVNVAAMLGHAKPTTTINVYSHAFRKQHEVTAAKMSTMYAKKREQIKVVK